VMVAIATAECGAALLGSSSVTMAVPRTCKVIAAAANKQSEPE
jgi:hypothetical protein